MKAKKLLTWLFVLMSIALLVVGFFLLKNAKWNGEGVKANITLVHGTEEKRVTGKVVEMENLSIDAPGFSESYQIKIKVEDDGSYSFTLDFNEKKDGGLKKYVDVTIKDGEKTVKETTLEALLDGGKVKFEKTLSSNKTLTLDVIYTMKNDYLDADGVTQEVDDELVGGTFASFDIKLDIKK